MLMNIVSIKKKEIFKGEKMSNEESKIVIANDPFKMIIEAVENVYPGKEAIVEFYPNLKVPGHTEIIDNIPVVGISIDIPFQEMVNELGYQLSRVVAGIDNKDNEKIKEIYDSIFNEYNRIGKERFGK